MSDSQTFSSLNINSLQESVLQKVCDLLDQTSDKGWRRLAGVVSSHSRFRLSSLELHQCSIKVMVSEGSPTRSLLRLMGERGCTTKDLTEFLQSIGQSDALELLKPPGIKVIVQPESLAVLSGQMAKLTCVGSGHPAVTYQWFKMKKEVPNGSSGELVFNPVHVHDAGFYTCRVNDGNSFDFSEWVQMEVYDCSLKCHGLPRLPDYKVQICYQPKSQRLTAGDCLVLECAAVGKPLPRYQWYLNGTVLRDATKNLYTVSSVSAEHQGLYHCRVTNGNELEVSGEAEIVVMATDKVALLIGNMSYRNHPQLKAPMVDVYELTNLLRQLEFKVVSLLDLTETEMRNAVNEFLLLLDKGVYALFYYAGHGYENYGNSFMVPIDAPKPYRSSNCLCVQSILKLMQEKETGLNVFLLDMCRKRNQYDDTVLIPESLKVTANIVFGYATCQGAEAFEIQHSDLANGIFMKFLKKRLLEDKKITTLLDQVGEDMGRCQLTKGMQALEIRSSLSAKRALTDPIQQTACSPESLARNLQWAKAHELPTSTCIEFVCGVKIKLGFAAEFSNVMIIYTRIIEKPPEIFNASASLRIPVMKDQEATNKGENLTFTVCLSYMYQGIEELLDEMREINIGKPLIAKLDIHSGLKRNFCVQTCHSPHSPCHSPELGSGAVEASPICTTSQYSQPNLSVYHSNLRTAAMNLEAIKPDVMSEFLTRSSRSRYFSKPVSTLKVPEETTEENFFTQ
ncbi:hypothetical protein GDO86_002543 [Hymenochirus boettgeri]|uniref:Mucosa-associated lymphoid tissue lymphoma translocation protein 1 n=1 Tax=Hymenochirus boettgeri TaxID=247094 RepID=A0A8T2KHA7_9PIPI|nr:hypothetical protein GDO86_002543 [Hymenochirus boettgeri]